MKKYIFSIVAFAFFLCLGCDEKMPVIDCLSCKEDAPPPPPETKRVMIEEFTGVRCIGCPAGSTEIKNLLNQSNGRLVAVSIHAGFFAKPYDESAYDFKTDGGDAILDYLGRPEANPAAVVDRKLFNGEADLQFVNTSAWAGRIAQQYDEIAKMNVMLDNTYDAASRSLSINVSGFAQELIDEEVRLTIMITESGIVDHQLTPESSPESNPDYVHDHVLRKVITAFEGDVLEASMVQGDTFEKSYTFTLPAEWKPADCNVIAFTHLAGSKKDILQVTEEHLDD